MWTLHAHGVKGRGGNGSGRLTAGRWCAPAARGDLPGCVVLSYIPLHPRSSSVAARPIRTATEFARSVSMEPTTLGQNRTGAAVHARDVDRMLEAVEELSPQVPISTAPIEAERLRNIAEADTIGSIPPPASLVKGSVKKGKALLNGVSPSLLM